MSDTPSVLFVCVHNAGRSQMAAGFLTHLGGGAVEVRSAGSAPAETINSAAVEAMATSRAIVDGIEASGRPVYGVSTGFGALANTSIAPERRAELQHALIRSHAAGIGAPVSWCRA